MKCLLKQLTNPVNNLSEKVKDVMWGKSKGTKISVMCELENSQCVKNVVFFN